MAALQMTPADLCELNRLLKLYIAATYGTAGRDSALLSEVSGRYKEQYQLAYVAGYPPEFMNTRNAGRKPQYTAEKKERIHNLYESVHRLNTSRRAVTGD